MLLTATGLVLHRHARTQGRCPCKHEGGDEKQTQDASHHGHGQTPPVCRQRTYSTASTASCLLRDPVQPPDALGPAVEMSVGAVVLLCDGKPPARGLYGGTRGVGIRAGASVERRAMARVHASRLASFSPLLKRSGGLTWIRWRGRFLRQDRHSVERDITHDSRLITVLRQKGPLMPLRWLGKARTG